MRRLALSLGLGLAGCDGAPGPAADAADVPPDAGAASACEERLIDAPPWSLHRCADGASLSIRYEELPLFEAVRIGLEVGGQITWGTAWPEVSWYSVDGDLTVRFFGRLDLPGLWLDLIVGEGAFLQPGIEAGDDITLDAIHLEGRLEGVPRLPTTVAGFFQGLQAGERAHLVHAFGLNLARVEAGGGQVRVVWPPVRVLASGSSISLDRVYVGAGSDALALADEAAGETLPLDGPRFGWRTGPAFGPAISVEALQREVEVLRGLARERGVVDHPAVLLEGAWFESLGEWPGGLVPTIGLGDVALGVVWPAAFGPGQPPEILDISLPADQDRISRSALDLKDAGVDWLVITGVPEDDARALAGLGRALVPFGGPVLTDQPRIAPHFDGLSLAGSLPDPQDCWLAALAGSRTCAPLTDPLPRPVGPLTDNLDALESWTHMAGRLLLDAGGVRLGGPPGEGRISAVLNAATGGPYLLADAPSQLTPAQADLFFEVFALNLGGLRPRAAVDGRATRWESAEALVLVNWTEGPTSMTLPERPGLEGAPRRLSDGPAYASGSEVLVPARDLVLYRK